ncbi:MAG: hypothetical protein EZS28_039148, partial [Streblomastix strix]
GGQQSGWCVGTGQTDIKDLKLGFDQWKQLRENGGLTQLAFGRSSTRIRSNLDLQRVPWINNANLGISEITGKGDTRWGGNLDAECQGIQSNILSSKVQWQIMKDSRLQNGQYGNEIEQIQNGRGIIPQTNSGVVRLRNNIRFRRSISSHSSL